MNTRYLFAACAAAATFTGLAVAGSAVIDSAPASAATATVPRPDHVVVLIEENRPFGDVIGSVNAPYINSLVAEGADMTQFHSETYYSQPNYVALLSGSYQGVTDDSCPHTFTAPNLAGELIASGAGFAGYSEDLPSVGYTGCTSGKYARKHNSWVDFDDVPADANQPFSAFPTDYSQLPAVSFVVPNLDNDMHDGTVAQGDTWLQQNLAGYVEWARTHNSVFVVTFDEDNGTDHNHIATVVVGQHVIPGDYPEQVNHYNLLRTLTDAYGVTAPAAAATAPPILDIWADSAATPWANFTSSCSGLTCTFDGSSSGDSNGAITSYQWDFGDSSGDTGAQVQHTFAGNGPFTVTLTVADDRSLSASTQHQVSPGPAAPSVNDTFARSVSGGLGTADVGGAWTIVGSAAHYSVSPGAAALALPSPGVQDEAYIGVGSTDTDAVTRLAPDKVPAGGPLYLTLTGRRVSAGNAYFAKVGVSTSGGVNLSLGRTTSGTQARIAGPIVVNGLTVTAGTVLGVRLQVVGTNPTTLRARVWRGDQAEPSSWLFTATDSAAALQAAGSVGVIAYLSGAATNAPLTVHMPAFTAGSTAASPNSPPSAAFTVQCAQLTCTFDASGSTDDKGITGYSWDFGDGATSTAAAPQHPYAAAGTYGVTLSVHDAEGAAGSVTHSVAVATSSAPFASDTFARTVTNGWAAADVGGSWSHGGTASRLAVGASGGTMRLDKGAQVECYLAPVSRTDADVFTVLSVDGVPAGGPVYATVEARRISSGTSYAARVLISPNGTARVRLSRFAAGAETVLAGPAIVGTVQAGRQISVRVQATGTGPTLLRARAWLTGTAEPTTWQVTATDATSTLQANGSVGLIGYLSAATTNGPITIAVTSFQGRPTT